MRRFCLLFAFLIVFTLPAISDDAEDLWTNYGIDITGGKEATAVSDEEFEKAIEQVDAKVNKWRNWAQKRKLPKGQEFSHSNETEILDNEHGDNATLPVITLPINIVIGEGVLPVGHYQVEGETIDGNAVLKIYQAGNLMTKIPAEFTNDDFEQEEILFANWLPYGDNQIKIIYGSLDFNAYAVVDIEK